MHKSTFQAAFDNLIRAILSARIRCVFFRINSLISSLLLTAIGNCEFPAQLNRCVSKVAIT